MGLLYVTLHGTLRHSIDSTHHPYDVEFLILRIEERE